MKAEVKYYLQQDGTFVFENYNQAKPFANFFPGIAGIWGIPMWVFYVNRGQGLASFGIESKDKAILEFQPANKSYRLTSTQGFRTFLKVTKGSVDKFYEPFHSLATSPYKVRQLMKITSHDMTIEEVNETLGLSVAVNYYTMPEEPFAGLVRHVTVKNVSKSELKIQMIDGLPLIIPYGQNDWVMKNMCRTIEAWYKVRNLPEKAPYFQLDVEAADVPQVNHIKEGNFYFAFDPKAKSGTLADPIVEAAAVFGQATDLLEPERFLAEKSFVMPKVQQMDNRTPSAMSFVKFSLKPQGVKEVISITGFAHSVDELNETVKKLTARGFMEKKRQRNKQIIDQIKERAFTHSSSPEFDAYCGQTFLDNVLRGGLPISLQTSEGPAVFNVYSRKHGDLERDYNAFRLSPTYLSQGNGNYRDVNQNRRNDVWFNLDLKENAVVNFFSLTQADGYNPLVVCGMMFVAEDAEKVGQILDKYVKSGPLDSLKTFLWKGFMPGDLFKFLVDHDIALKCPAMEFLTHVLGGCQKFETAQHGEGFWSDHWTYNLDLLESYLALYPENLKFILMENRDFFFYHNSVHTLPRDKRYILTSRGVRQYESLHEGRHDKDKGHKLRVHRGAGEVYYTSLLVKMLCLIANKAATLDPSGIGVEMEANKPSWYDSLNGLPGLLGSSISETFELRRFAQFVLESLDKMPGGTLGPVAVFEELHDFIAALVVILEQSEAPLDYWKKANDVKEAYRLKVREGISGLEKPQAMGDVRRLLKSVIRRTDKAAQAARDKDGLFPTYFFHKVTKYEYIRTEDEGKENAHVRPLEFQRHDMPLFLEGFMHALKSEQDPGRALALHEKVRKSSLFDKTLKLYKLNADITSETEEVGRTRVFPRGWLENESIWLHMQYKYLLELLRQGLYQEFYQDLDSSCVAFMDPARYGRSILENSSFIVSSAHPDKSLHGQGFVARLSGSTAEFVNMWMFMSAGVSPFSLSDNGKLQLVFGPVLKGCFFSKEKAAVLYADAQLTFPAGTYAFNFMGRTLVVYHNSSRRDTFGVKAAAVKRAVLQYAGVKKTQEIAGAIIPAPFAGDVRDGKVERIDIYLE
ncbi:MAG: hypothetical protein HQL18_02675 [Candidatus Omnitrophica bacterium]|nr:hypothetical protein [Candidatus Omnitrophota bacterium]